MSHSDSETLLERSYPAEPAQLCEIRSAVTELSRRQGLSERQAAEVALAISEAVANIVAHGYQHRPGHTVRLSIRREGRKLVFLLDDDAPCLEPDKIVSRPLDELRPGGLGVHFMKALMNEVSYEPREGGGNRLRMTREL